jgi:hypothetical protein
MSPPIGLREVKSNRKASAVTEITDSKKNNYPPSNLIGTGFGWQPLGGRVGHAVVSIATYAALGHVLHRMHQNLPLPPFVMVPYFFLLDKASALSHSPWSYNFDCA